MGGNSAPVSLRQRRCTVLAAEQRESEADETGEQRMNGPTSQNKKYHKTDKKERVKKRNRERELVRIRERVSG